MRVQFTRKLADQLDGIDVSHYREGDVITLPAHDAALLLAEGWAQLLPRRRSTLSSARVVAADASQRLRTVEQLRQARQAIERRHAPQREQRRAEDHIREEWQDAHARVITAGLEKRPETDDSEMAARSE